jgi:2-polyprenyl-6-methoxyphenol hydroxylase-like FAD-dependent oxidoreductase
MANGESATYVTDRACESWDPVIVGGGPAGLAVAIVAAAQGVSVPVLERRDFLPDQACGEVLLRPGVRALERLGVTPILDGAYAPVRSALPFIQENGAAAADLLAGHPAMFRSMMGGAIRMMVSAA